MYRWEKNIRRTEPYVPGEQPKERDLIKLNTNENPYPPSPGVYEAHRNARVDRWALYPELGAASLVEALADYYQIRPEQVFAGVGSDDVLSLAFLTFFNSDKPILFPDITYSFYPVWANIYRIPYACPPVDGHFRICPEDYCRENGGIVIANPNAPTSLGMTAAEMEKIVRENQDSVVIADEAYVDFGGESVLPLIDTYENLLVVRTYSKSRSLAGMRIGFAMGSRKLIQAMNNVKESINSYTMTTESIRAGVASLKDEAYFQEKLRQIKATRERVGEELKKREFHVPDSQTNFLFVRHSSVPGKEIFDALRERKIIVRHFGGQRIRDYLRITVGTDSQMDRLLAALDEILAS